MAVKFKVQQYFDTYPDGHWSFDTEKEALDFYNNKRESLRGRYKTQVKYIGQVELEEK